MTIYNSTMAYRSAQLTRMEFDGISDLYDSLKKSPCLLRPDTGIPCPRAYKSKETMMCEQCPVRLGLPSQLTAEQVEEMAKHPDKVQRPKIHCSHVRPVIPHSGQRRDKDGKCAMPWCQEWLKAGQGYYCRKCVLAINSRIFRGKGNTIEEIHAPLKRKYAGRSIRTMVGNGQ